MDPEDVTSPTLEAFDKAIDHLRQAQELMRDLRAVDYTRAYHRLRQQRIRSNAPAKHEKGDPLTRIA